MRYLIILLCVILTLTSCASVRNTARLGYQDSGIYVEGEFTVGDDSFPAELTLTAPRYDNSGRMLAREGKLIFSEGSVIEGVGFEFSGSDMYIFSESMKIPLENETATAGISRIISLFCISEGSYHSAERQKEDGTLYERAVYTDGENRVEVTLDLSTMLPVTIIAEADGCEIGVKIREIRLE